MSAIRDLDHHERHHSGSGPTPPEARVIHELIREEGEKTLERSVKAMAWSALGAGLSMGFSFFTMAIIRSALPEGAPWSKLVSSLGYTIGFIIVILGRQQLFTESTLSSILPLLTRKDVKTLWQVAAALGDRLGVQHRRHVRLRVADQPPRPLRCRGQQGAARRRRGGDEGFVRADDG